jgi:hypothetical protein
MLEPIEQTGLYVAMITGILGFIISLTLAIKEIYVSFFIKPDLFIEIHNDKDTFGPELSVPELNVIRKRLKVRIG